MPKLSKSGLFKTMGVGAVSTPAIGATVYGFSKQAELQTLKTTNAEQKKKIDILEADPANINKLKKVQQAETTDTENKQLKRENEELKNKNKNLEIENGETKGLKTSVHTLSGEVTRLKKELQNEQTKVKNYETSEKDIWDPTKRLLRELVKWMRTKRGYTSKGGYDRQNIGMGTWYGGGVPDILWICKTKEGGLTARDNDGCNKTMTLKELEEWSKEVS